MYSYPETLIIIELKPYLQRKIDKGTKEILKKLNDLNQLFDHTENASICD